MKNQLPKIRYKYQNISVLILIFVLFFYENKAQDVISSHRYLTNAFNNPAYSGIHPYIDLDLNYRNQFPGLGKAFNTYKAGLNGFTFKNNMGLGAIITRDVSGGGVFSTSEIGLFYTYTLNINPFSKVSFGLQSSVYQRVVNYDGLSSVPAWASEYSIDQGFREPKIYPNFAAGIAYQKDNFLCSFGFFNILQQVSDGQELVSQPRRYQLQISYHKHFLGNMSDRENGITTFLGADYQGDAKYLSYGAWYVYGIFEPGFWFRHEISSIKSSTIVLSSKINFLYLYIVYSFDLLLTNSLSTFNNFGVHEVTLGYHIKYKGKRKNGKGTINCPYE